MSSDTACALGNTHFCLWKFYYKMSCVNVMCENVCILFIISVAQDRLRFHPRCGILVKLSANNKYVISMKRVVYNLFVFFFNF